MNHLKAEQRKRTKGSGLFYDVRESAILPVCLVQSASVRLATSSTSSIGRWRGRRPPKKRKTTTASPKSNKTKSLDPCFPSPPYDSASVGFDDLHAVRQRADDAIG